MPRVEKKTKSTAGKPYTCTKCHEPIAPRTEYYSWSFRYGGTYRQHVSCGYPRRGQLTQSKLASVYNTQDDANETISKAEDCATMADALTSVAEAAREVAEEYREAVEAMNMAGSGTDNEERADQLEEWAEELEEAAEALADAEFETEDDADTESPTNDEGQTEDEWLEERRGEASDALGNCPV